jgi:hypothetical protein
MLGVAVEGEINSFEIKIFGICIGIEGGWWPMITRVDLSFVYLCIKMFELAKEKLPHPR